MCFVYACATKRLLCSARKTEKKRTSCLRLNHTLKTVVCNDHIVVNCQKILFWHTKEIVQERWNEKYTKSTSILSLSKTDDSDMSNINRLTWTQWTFLCSFFCNWTPHNSQLDTLHLGDMHRKWCVAPQGGCRNGLSPWGPAIIHNHRQTAWGSEGLGQLMKNICASQDLLALPSSSAWPTPFILHLLFQLSNKLASLTETTEKHVEGKS